MANAVAGHVSDDYGVCYGVREWGGEVTALPLIRRGGQK